MNTKISPRKRLRPLGTGYFILYILGYVVLIFAVGLLTFEYGATMITMFFEGKPCLLWVFVLIAMLIGLTMIWLAQKQGGFVR